MKKTFKLSNEDIESKSENVLELFYSGIKSDETKRTMKGNLRVFLEDICADIFSGTFEERAQQFVELARKDQEKTIQIILAYVRHLRSRTKLAKNNENYLNPSTIPNRIKPIKKLLEMNGLGLGWKRIHSSFPELNNIHQGRGYTREEIKTILEHSNDVGLDFVILAASSGGLRIGVWENVTWDDVKPVYQIKDKFTLEEPEENSKVVCAAMRIYKGTSEEYIALISREAWDKLQEYRKEWIRKAKRKPLDSDPLLLERYSKLKARSPLSIKKKIERTVIKSGIRSPLTEGKRRYEVPTTHGFRRYFDKVMMESTKKSDLLSALVKKERLLGHSGLVKTDANYYWTTIEELVPDYLEAMPEITINNENRLELEIEKQNQREESLKNEITEKEKTMRKVKELEAKIIRIEKYQRITSH